MSAREEARAASLLAFRQTSNRALNEFTPAHLRTHDAVIAAGDAASDVWEPLLRNLIKVIEEMLSTGSFTPRHQETLTEAKEALGG